MLRYDFLLPDGGDNGGVSKNKSLCELNGLEMEISLRQSFLR